MTVIPVFGIPGHGIVSAASLRRGAGVQRNLLPSFSYFVATLNFWVLILKYSTVAMFGMVDLDTVLYRVVLSHQTLLLRTECEVTSRQFVFVMNVCVYDISVAGFTCLTLVYL
jgi:hypothetical protein